MSGFFSYDNPVMRFIGKLGDVILLNILWVLCSLPIVTIGAATTAVYYATLKIARDEDGHTIRDFFKSFLENLRQSTIIWLILMAAGFVIGFDLYLLTMAQGISATLKVLMMAVFIALSIVYLSVFIYIFPIQARFYNTVKKTFINAAFMSVRHLPQTILMLVINGVIVLLMFTYVPQLVLFGYPLMAFLNSYLLNPIFRRYIPEQTSDVREVQPVFSDEEAKK